MKLILKQCSLLYAEDKIDVQKNISEYLNHFFKTIYLASDGREALQKYHQYHPDALLLDIDMPHMDGLEVAQEIRKKNKDIPIIILTAFTDTDKLLPATELKLTKYLQKPISPKAFDEALELLSQELIESSSKIEYLEENFSWGTDNKMLYKDDTIVKLTDKESILLALFMDNRGKCVLFEDIMAYVWEDEFEKEISIESVKNQVSHLRKKLPKNSIESVYGKGYRLK